MCAEHNGLSVGFPFGPYSHVHLAKMTGGGQQPEPLRHPILARGPSNSLRQVKICTRWRISDIPPPEFFSSFLLYPGSRWRWPAG